MHKKGVKRSEFKYYLDYSIGFLTRGCFRQCEFCVNKNYNRCVKHSNLDEFIEYSRPKLCFLDDNFFACTEWKKIIQIVKSTGKRFQFKQGLDERLLTADKINELISWKYDGDFIFAFDNISDSKLIEEKLTMLYNIHPNFSKSLKFYVFCGYDRDNKYDSEFWIDDIESLFKRCKILAKYSATPYVMRHENYKNAPELYKGMYTYIASWCNQNAYFVKMSFNEYATLHGVNYKVYKEYKNNLNEYIKHGYKKGKSWRIIDSFETNHIDLFNKYCHWSGQDIALYGKYKKIKE